MELVIASPSSLLVIPSALVHTHPDFEGLIALISSRIEASDSIQEQSSLALVVRQEMGYVYAAWNPLFPDLIKIGATMRAFPIMRVEELSSWAGVPEPFQLVASITTPDPFALEREIHRHFDSVRKYGRKKEFFLIAKEEIGYHFHVRSLQVHNERKESAQTKKRKVYNDSVSTECAKIVRSFVELHIDAVSNDTHAFVPTQKIYETFQRECSATTSTMQRITFTNFSMELAKQIADLFPEACRIRNNLCKGYAGIMLK
jgi:hypothetical protein